MDGLAPPPAGGRGQRVRGHGISGRGRAALGCVVAALILGPLAWLWHASLLPAEYSVMDMGYVDEGEDAVGGIRRRRPQGPRGPRRSRGCGSP